MNNQLARIAADQTNIKKTGLANLGWLSINRYDAVCLNSTSVFFGDIDCVKNPKAPHKPVLKWSVALSNIDAVASKYGVLFRCYRTHSGIRVIEVSQTYVANSSDTTSMQRALGCDKAYVMLTRQLNNFRARLTPKPWRTNDGELPKFDTPESVDLFINSRTFAVAEHIGNVGEDAVVPADVTTVINLHDQFCLLEGAPLA